MKKILQKNVMYFIVDGPKYFYHLGPIVIRYCMQIFNSFVGVRKLSLISNHARCHETWQGHLVHNELDFCKFAIHVILWYLIGLFTIYFVVFCTFCVPCKFFSSIWNIFLTWFHANNIKASFETFEHCSRSKTISALKSYNLKIPYYL